MEYKRNGKILQPIKVIAINSGLKIGVYQGDRGEKPELDIIVKYKDGDKRLRTPKHIHWVIDILIKKEHDRILTLSFLKFLQKAYNKIERFKDKDEQLRTDIKTIKKKDLIQFEKLNNYGEYSVEFIGTLIELFIKMEKNHPNPFIFRDLIQALIEEKDIFSIVSKATHNGR